ncbi:MAG: metallophosphoesterase, partial [Oscillospiraceae bacterium]|nr:metallophosphoesterase [Oscillospiraceae bacterium]
MVYCISDIHGEYDRFKKMLEHIEFSEKDHMYILGDAIDRGPQGIQALQHIMRTPNMTMIMGNHEQMCLYSLEPYCDSTMQRMWKMNGGKMTFGEMTAIRPAEEVKEILSFISTLPDYLEITVNGRDFYLVHGLPAGGNHGRVWGRPDDLYECPIKDKTVIIGHTPVWYLSHNEFEPYKIWHGKGYIDIDCGCG